MLQINDTTYASGAQFPFANAVVGELTPADFMVYSRQPRPNEPYYQPLKDSYEFWGGKFSPSIKMVLNEMARRGWIVNDFAAKKQWRNK